MLVAVAVNSGVFRRGIDSSPSADLKQDGRGSRQRCFFTGGEESLTEGQNSATGEREEDL